ncbi:hypothetical protein WN51_02230 [Melipona quadrifasciata]|uniref:Uncharacterized protein n=1 Tax=Melipona quadrifasciata TaxID=166423 RepID=A0A0M8ZVE8_9HYME|nr:hypothetical protein WN51_02230 [Melipona quadrifasciata]
MLENERLINEWLSFLQISTDRLSENTLFRRSEVIASLVARLVVDVGYISCLA